MEKHFEYTAARRNALKKSLQEKLDEILNTGSKRPIAPSELQLRLNARLRNKLEEDSFAPEAYTLYRQQADQPVEKADLGESYARIAKKMAEETESAENFENWSAVSVFEMIDDGILKPEEISNDNFMQLARLIHRYESIFYKIKSARMNGDYAYEKTFLSELPIVSKVKKENITSKSSKSNQDIMLKDLINKYCDTQIKDGEWKEHTIQDHKGRLDNILDILGNKAIGKISREDMRNFRSILEQLPPSRKKIDKYKNISWQKIIESKPEKTLSVKTINVIIQAVSSMFEWAIREGLMEQNPARRLSKKDEQAPIDKREPFTTEEIKMIFYDGEFEKLRVKNEAYYWAPFIALYTGMRLEEICQLHCADIYEDNDGIWLIDIREEDENGVRNKKIKTVNARRQIPIHEELIRLGLLKYHKDISESSERLFPQLNITEKTTKYGKQVGKAFSRYVKSKGIAKGKSFHSLRHTFADFYKIHHLQNDIFRQIFGHEIEELAGRQYGSRFSPKQCYDEIISKLKYF